MSCTRRLPARRRAKKGARSERGQRSCSKRGSAGRNPGSRGFEGEHSLRPGDDAGASDDGVGGADAGPGGRLLPRKDAAAVDGCTVGPIRRPSCKSLGRCCIGCAARAQAAAGLANTRVLCFPPGLMAGVVDKVRDAAGNLLGVRTHALFGRVKDIRRRIKKLKLGKGINTAHVERFNGTARGRLARLARKTRDVSRRGTPLRAALALCRDIYNWVHPHGALAGATPAMAMGLAAEIWTMKHYVVYPVHAAPWQRAIWVEEQEKRIRSALDGQKRPESFCQYHEELPGNPNEIPMTKSEQRIKRGSWHPC